MAATSDIKLTLGYADDSTRNLNIGPYATNASVLAGAKAAVINFNTNEINSIQSLLLSDDGASCTGIVDAHIITVNETEINLNDAE